MDATAGLLTMDQLSKLINRKQNSEQNTSSSPILNPKPFVWDSIIFSLASTIFGLSVSGIIVEFFKSDQNSVTCFTELENRAQYTYVNNYCYKFLRTAEYFPVILVLHAAALVVPHYLWKVVFSAQFDSFFSHAAKVETLRDIKTGEYPHQNYSIVDYLQKEFDGRKAILKSYVMKLISQLLLVLTSIAVNVTVFNDIDFNITFYCNDDHERSHLFGNVTCAYPRKIFINVLQVADYIVLAVAVIVLAFSLFWCLIYNHCTQVKIADFCYHSCIDAKYYKPPRTRLSCRQLKNDLNFLLALLSATNTGLGGIFTKILVENIVCQKFSDDKNTFIKNDPLRHKVEDDFLDKRTYADIKDHSDLSPSDTVNGIHQQQQEQQQQQQQPNDNIQNQDHVAVTLLDESENRVEKPLVDRGTICKKVKEKMKQAETKSFAKVIIEICNGIREEQKVLSGVEEFKEFTTSAMDIACGYHSYLFAIARWQLQTISILLGPQSKEQDELFMCEHHDCVNIMKMPMNLFDSQEHNNTFLDRIQLYLGNESDQDHSKLSLVVVGPLDDGSKVTTVNKIIEMLSDGFNYFKEDCVMLILQPVEVEGEDISESFIEWKPEIVEWHESDLSKYIEYSSWLKNNRDTISISKYRKGCGVITAQCGKLNCKFKLKTFYYGSAEVY